MQLFTWEHHLNPISRPDTTVTKQENAEVEQFFTENNLPVVHNFELPAESCPQNLQKFDCYSRD